MHPGRGSAKEATSGVFAGPAWPDFASPAVASLGAIPPRPPVVARAAGEAAGLDGSENSMDLNVPKPDPAATSQRGFGGEVEISVKKHSSTKSLGLQLESDLNKK